MNRLFLAAISVALAGCASRPAPQSVDPFVTDALAPGAERKKPAAPQIEQALIPPLRMEMPLVGGLPIDGRFDPPGM